MLNRAPVQPHVTRRWLFGFLAVSAAICLYASIGAHELSVRWIDVVALVAGGIGGTFAAERVALPATAPLRTAMFLQFLSVAFYLSAITTMRNLPVALQIVLSLVGGAFLMGSMVYAQRVRLRPN